MGGELKPCPFCGSPGEIARPFSTRSRERMGRCSDAECIAHIPEQDEQGGWPNSSNSEADAIEAWNRRASPPPPSGSAWGVKDERLFWFLTVLASTGGSSDATESKYAWINAFCQDREADTDTFNLAIENLLTTATHDTSYDTSVVHLTDAGREYLATSALTPSPSYAEGIEAAALWHEQEIVRLEAQIDENNAYTLREGIKDHAANDFCRDQINLHGSSAYAIRALPTPPNVKVAP